MTNKDKTIRIVVSIGIVAVLAMLWGKQSDLAYNVAQQRAILLGRYTLDAMITLLVVTPILLAALWGLWKKKTPPADLAAQRLAKFKIISLVVSILLAIVFVDVALRLTQRKVYVGTEQSYHRAPNNIYHGVFNDKPEFAFSYPKTLPGYPDVAYTLTVDARGFRNPQALDQADWIVLGDSFAEGSGVSDEQVWVRRLAEKRGVTIYNLGMSGGSPVTYLDTLQKFGVALNPKVALYMLYEGNDFRDSNFRAAKLEDPRKASLSERLFKASPLRRLIKESILRTFQPIGRDRFKNDATVFEPSHRMYPVAWLPIEIPAGGGYGYAFDVKRLEQHYITEEEFRQTVACKESLRLMQEAKAVCQANGIAMVVIYAPDTPHVLIDAIVSQVPAEQLRAFMATRQEDLPEAEAFVAALKEGLAVRQRVMEAFCRSEGLPFIALTDILSQKTLDGVKTYYAYDQHWTPDGHQVVADYLADCIQR